MSCIRGADPVAKSNNEGSPLKKSSGEVGRDADDCGLRSRTAAIPLLCVV